MNIYEKKSIGERIKGNSYVGRGIAIGLSSDGTKAVCAYFIMGRSANSRNRIFIKEGRNIKILPYDPSKVEDPSLIIYYPVRIYGDSIIVTNGDQTDTVYDFMAHGKSFEDALMTRTFEPDYPNWTPRISGLIGLNGSKCAPIPKGRRAADSSITTRLLPAREGLFTPTCATEARFLRLRQIRSW